MKIGLVVCGGGLAGIYSAGVIEYLIEKQIEFPYVIGVSMGSCCASSYISKQLCRNKESILKFLNNKKYFSFTNFLRTGNLFGMDFIFNEIPSKHIFFDLDTFYKNKSKFYIVVTNCDTGKAEYIEKNDSINIKEVFKASCSIPLISNIVKIKGINYLDGCIADPIPIEKAISDGCDKLIVIINNINDEKKIPKSIVNLLCFRYRDYPKLNKLFITRDKIIDKSLARIKELEKNKKVLVIRPYKKLNINAFKRNPKTLINAYNYGYNQIRDMEEELLNFINN